MYKMYFDDAKFRKCKNGKYYYYPNGAFSSTVYIINKDDIISLKTLSEKISYIIMVLGCGIVMFGGYVEAYVPQIIILSFVLLFRYFKTAQNKMLSDKEKVINQKWRIKEYYLIVAQTNTVTYLFQLLLLFSSMFVFGIFLLVKFSAHSSFLLYLSTTLGGVIILPLLAAIIMKMYISSCKSN